MPRQALSSRGLGGSSEHGPLDRLFEQMRGLPFLLTLSLRNTFRRKGRMTLTLLTLTFVGILFMVVTSVQLSLDNAIEVLLQSFRYDVMVVFARPYRTEHLLVCSTKTSLPSMESRQATRSRSPSPGEKRVGW